jgi:hypothetical protein
LTHDRQLLTKLNGALFSLAGLHDVVASLGGGERSASHLHGRILLLETVAWGLIQEVEGCDDLDGH